MKMKRCHLGTLVFCLYHFGLISIGSSTEKQQDVPPFAITKLITYNMKSTVYWKPAKFLGNKSIEYHVEFNDGVKNHSLLCTSPRWHQKSGDLSCLFLTCNSTILDVSYEVRVKAGNSSAVTPVVLHNPTEENIPLPISDVYLSSNFTAVVLNWKLSSTFCPNSAYCMEISYHKIGSGNNESALVSSKGKKTFQWKITGLLPCSEYLFYVTTYQIGLCFFPEFRLATTGPYGIATLPTDVIRFSAKPITVRNFNAVIYWSQPKNCSYQATAFAVYFKKDDPDENWTKSNCTIGRNKAKNEFSCLFLTCNTVKDQSYLVLVKRVNSLGRKKIDPFLFHPFTENVPDQITNVTVSAITSKSVQVSWKMPSWFCSKFTYCLRFYYHGESENKTIEVTDEERENQLKAISNLSPYTKYTFYVETFPYILGCSIRSDDSYGPTGPFTGRTLEDVPSSPPVLICGLCDVTVDSMAGNGTVKWRLPAKEKWNGLPRVFTIQWRENYQNESAVWHTVTIKKKLAREGHITGLALYEEYVVRVRMCNGQLCSIYSKEVVIEAKNKEPTSSSNSKKLALSVGLSAVFIILSAVLVYICIKKSQLWDTRINPPSLQLPPSECRSYENIGSPLHHYVQFSPRDENCSLSSFGLRETNTSFPEEDNRSSANLFSDTV